MTVGRMHGTFGGNWANIQVQGLGWRWRENGAMENERKHRTERAKVVQLEHSAELNATGATTLHNDNVGLNSCWQ
jgi:hypothetical protein